MAISSQVGACPVTPLQFEDHPSTQACLTGPRNKPREKQSREPLVMIHTWIVSSLMELLNVGEKLALPLCVWKPAFVKYGHIFSYMFIVLSY